MRGNRVVSDRRDTERVNANYTPESNPLSPAHQAVKSKITNNPASSSKIGMHIVEFAGFLFALEPPGLSAIILKLRIFRKNGGKYERGQ